MCIIYRPYQSLNVDISESPSLVFDCVGRHVAQTGSSHQLFSVRLLIVWCAWRASRPVAQALKLRRIDQRGVRHLNEHDIANPLG